MMKHEHNDELFLEKYYYLAALTLYKIKLYSIIIWISSNPLFFSFQINQDVQSLHE